MLDVNGLSRGATLYTDTPHEGLRRLTGAAALETVMGADGGEAVTLTLADIR